MKKTILIISLLICTLSTSQELSKIIYSEAKINIDGQLDEPIWSTLSENTGFFNYSPTDEGLASNQTSVKIFHNGINLYISAVYKDDTPKTQVASLKRDDIFNVIASSDSFVIILDSQNQQQSAYYLGVNINAVQTDGLIERISGDSDGYTINTSWNTVWKTQTSTQGNLKFYEIEIPLKSLNYDANNPVFGITFYVKDIKKNTWTISSNVKRNYRLFDLRFTTAFQVENLTNVASNRFTITPAITANAQRDMLAETSETNFKPSLDVQYNLSSSLKLDATINPDFSQIDVDQQVTNLTRFSLFFPERRNFFLENSDLFSNLGVEGVNPFYSRRIGANSDIQFGLKLSGNLSPKTRIGILNVQSSEEDNIAAQNFTAFVAEQQLSKNFTATGYLINRQETDKFDFKNDYNRVAGINLNFKSDNNKWIGLANFGKSFNDDLTGENDFYNAEIYYNQRGFSWNAAVKNVAKNYLTDVGFTPRLYNYDAINDIVVREGYTQLSGGTVIQKFYEKSKTLNSVRYLNYNNDTYFDDKGKLNQMTHFINSSVFFKNLSSVYYVFRYNHLDLKYGFDPLGNTNSIQPDTYNYGTLKLGYNSQYNKRFRYNLDLETGDYYNGKITSAGAYFNYQLLPFANLEAAYDISKLNLNELGEETFHLARITAEIFFSNRLNWTNYLQYNTQRDNFNINSRLQWEYKPLSYVYLVLTDNLNESFTQKNWGIAFKMNYRFEL